MDRLSRLQGISGELDNQFAVASSGATVLIDGDILAYNVTANVAKLSTAIRRFQQEVLKAIFLTKAQRAIVHLTSSSGDKNKRKLIVADLPYQSNRAGKAKPPLLEALRVSMSKESNWLDMFECYLWEDIEADDALMIDAYRLKDKGIMYSVDKDLRQTPYPYYEIKTGKLFPALDGIGWVDLRYTEGSSGAGKLTGHGELFLWTQMLAGDKVDNVKGLKKAHGKNIGDTSAVAEMRGITDREEMIDKVMWMYAAIDQNPIPELWMLYLLQAPDKTAIDYLLEQPVSPDVRKWINKLFKEVRWLK